MYPELVVVFAFENQGTSAAWDSAIVERSKCPDFQFKSGQMVEAQPSSSPRVLLVGLGLQSEWTMDVARKVFAALGRKLAALKVSQVTFDVHSEMDKPTTGQVLGESIGMLSWRFVEHKTQTDQDLTHDLEVSSLQEKFDSGLARGLELANSVNFARTLVATPPNHATPLWMAEKARGLERLGLKVKVLQGNDLTTEKLQGLIEVGKASENPPCLIRIEYSPNKTTDQKPVVIVGKTITYDTGGLAIKSKDGMKGMKYDKSGGCAVLGVMHAVASILKPSFPIVGILVAAENSISSNAFRMDDIFAFRNGKTVEVTNTDAEGRLVLADGLCWAAECENPSAIVDLATLTGGIVTALGGVYAGLFSNSDTLAETLISSGLESGEKIWRMPLHPDYTETMKSQVADLVNSAPTSGGHPIQGAAFLAEFVPDEIPWAHIDIAGVSKKESDSGAYCPGPTGFGVRLIVDYLSRI